MNKKWTSLFSAALIGILWVTSAPALAADTEINVELEGKKLALTEKPFKYNDRTFVPMRAIFEQMGATVEWDGETQTVTGTKGDVTVKLTIGSNTAYRNNAPIELDVAPMVQNGRTFVPVRFIAESFNNPVRWSESTQTVTILPSNRSQLEKVLEQLRLPTQFHTEDKITTKLTNGNLTMNGTMEVIGDIKESDDFLEMHTLTKASGPIHAGLKSIEMYLTKDNIYMNFNEEGWLTSKHENLPAELKSLGYQKRVFKLPTTFANYMTLDETEDHYILRVRLDGPAFKRMYLELDDEINLQDSDISSLHLVEYTYKIDKKTFYPVETESRTKTTLNDMEHTMELKEKLTPLNELTITVPEEVKSNAKPMEEK
jgi:hypothetical protein